ncbi:hypothetical protein D3C80_1657920 [compost metagenome]
MLPPATQVFRIISTTASSAPGTSHLSSALAFIVITSRSGWGQQNGLFEARATGDEVGNRGVFSTADRPEESMLEGRGEQLGLKSTWIELHRL